MKRYDQELFKLALPCLSAVAGALPPDYMESNYMAMMEKQSSMDSEGNFTPRPADTAKYAKSVFFSTPLHMTLCFKTWNYFWCSSNLHDVVKLQRLLCIKKNVVLSVVISVTVPENLDYFITRYAEHNHEKWCLEKVIRSWVRLGLNSPFVSDISQLHVAWKCRPYKHILCLTVFQRLVIWGTNVWNLQEPQLAQTIQRPPWEGIPVAPVWFWIYGSIIWKISLNYVCTRFGPVSVHKIQILLYHLTLYDLPWNKSK